MVSRITTTGLRNGSWHWSYPFRYHSRKLVSDHFWFNLLPVWILDGAGATNALDKSDRWWLLGACVLLAAGLQVWSFLLLAGGMGFRLATKDFPPVPSRGTLAYYIGVLILLGGILHFVPMGLPANQG